jgi:glucose/arabinose dehydrogenase
MRNYQRLSRGGPRWALCCAVALATAAGCSTADSPSVVTRPAVDTVTTQSPPQQPRIACDAGNGGLILPAGFCATVFALVPGAPRHIVASDSGEVYVVLAGDGILMLRDTTGDGHADISQKFGSGAGTGIARDGAFLLLDARSQIVRFDLAHKNISGTPVADTIVTGLPTGGQHTSRTLAIDASGNLFVSIGSTNNACEGQTRDPCAELATRAGIWKFRAKTANQQFTSSARFATGIRNAVGIAINPVNQRLWVAQHGRDDLHT